MDVEVIGEFFREVDWTEPWLLGLLGFHLTTTVAIVLLRNHQFAQACILSVLAILCFSSERINEYAAMNYKRFAQQQYFDASGFFIFMVFAGPIIFNCFLIVLCWLWSTWDLMGRMAVAKARRHQRKKSEQSVRETKKNQ